MFNRLTFDNQTKGGLSFLVVSMTTVVNHNATLIRQCWSLTKLSNTVQSNAHNQNGSGSKANRPIVTRTYVRFNLGRYVGNLCVFFDVFVSRSLNNAYIDVKFFEIRSNVTNFGIDISVNNIMYVLKRRVLSLFTYCLEDVFSENTLRYSCKYLKHLCWRIGRHAFCCKFIIPASSTWTILDCNIMRKMKEISEIESRRGWCNHPREGFCSPVFFARGRHVVTVHNNVLQMT